MVIDPTAYFQCQTLIHRLWNALDHRKVDEVMACLTDDARWQREMWFEGQSAIRAALLARPKEVVIRHAFTNLIVDRDDMGFAARCLMLAQMTKVSGDSAPPFKAPPLAVVADLHVRIRQVDGEWKAHEISFDPVFQN